MKKLVVLIGLLVVIIWIGFPLLNREETNRSVTIHGKISPYYSYKLRSVYKATRNMPFCKTGYLTLFGEPYRKEKYFLYKPKINNNQHSITVPLNEMSLGICDYQLERIELIDRSESTRNTLFVNDISFGYSSNIQQRNHYRTSQLLPILRSEENNDFTIDFYSHVDYNTYYKELLKEEKEHNVLVRDTVKELKLLHKLIVSPYIRKYKKFPKESTLFKTNKLLYVDEKDRGKSLEKLYNNITYINETPVDEWGNPFLLKIIISKGRSTYDHVKLFSLGEDGVESKDDIYSGISQGLPDPSYDENPQVRKMVIDTIKSINSLSSLLTKFQYKYKKVANINEAKELFKKDNKYNIHPRKLNLIYLNDEPVDAWNQPFIYDLESDKMHPLIYSFGEDGIRSGDDIKRKMYRLF